MKKILIIPLILLQYQCHSSGTKSVICEQPFDVQHIQLKNDTLQIVSLSQYLYYPLGQHSSSENFAEENNLNITKSQANIFSYSYQHSYLKLYASDETQKLEIVEALIKDNSLKLSNVISIKMSKSDFLSHFGISISESDFNKVNVIEMESALLGIWHYYNFENDILQSITIKSDYVF